MRELKMNWRMSWQMTWVRITDFACDWSNNIIVLSYYWTWPGLGSRWSLYRSFQLLSTGCCNGRSDIEMPSWLHLMSLIPFAHKALLLKFQIFIPIYFASVLNSFWLPIQCIGGVIAATRLSCPTFQPVYRPASHPVCQPVKQYFSRSRAPRSVCINQHSFIKLIHRRDAGD